MFVVLPNIKGAVAELAIAKAAAQLGLAVYGPLTEHGRYDLVIEIAGVPQRVQCKWGRLIQDGSVICVQIGGSRITPAGYVRSVYDRHEIDLVGVYCGEIDRCFLIPIEIAEGRSVLHLRLKPTRNGQRAAVREAAKFEFAGAIAQLEERCHGMAEVVGSSPTSSTPPAPVVIGADEFRNRLGWYTERAAAGESFRITRHGRPYIRVGPAAEQLPLEDAA